MNPPRKEDNNPTIENVRSLLECPVCLDGMYPPIHQCSNGHVICSSCKPHVRNRCPICRQEFSNIRCLVLEKMAASLDLPFKYKCYGCVGIYPYNSKQEHESQCKYQPYNCPYPESGCNLLGNVPYLVNHLKDDHKVHILNGSTIIKRYVKSNTDNAIWIPTVFSCFGQYFSLHFEAFQVGNNPFYIAFLCFMGERSEGKKYRYILNVEGSGRKMIWQGVPRSIRDSHRTIRDSYDGLLIRHNVALFLSSGDDCRELNLTVTGQIWQEKWDNIYFYLVVAAVTTATFVPFLGLNLFSITDYMVQGLGVMVKRKTAKDKVRGLISGAGVCIFEYLANLYSDCF